MKHSIFWLILTVIILIVGIAIYGFLGPLQHRAQAPTATLITATSTTQLSATTTAISSSTSTEFDPTFNYNEQKYMCDGGKTIYASYYPDDASLTLSDGRYYNLAITPSASGIRYENTKEKLVFVSKGNNAFLQENGKITYNNCVAGTSSQTATSTDFTDQSNTFSFYHPTEFSVSGGGIGFSTDWRQGATSSGMLLAIVTIPKSYQSNTNFSEAKFTVGTSADPQAVSSCTTADNGESVIKTNVMLHETPFVKIVMRDAGAGNYYETTSYRTVKNNQCYAIEYTIHSTNITNYPSGSGITEFDKTKVQSVLEYIVQTFNFL